MNRMNTTSLKYFKGLEKSIKTITKVHSYTMDLGFALGLLNKTKHNNVEFQVDGGKYRPSILSDDEWQEIVRSSRFHLKPRYIGRKGVFHSKAWFFKQGLLLGSCNLSVGEARNYLNFWCWIPDVKGVDYSKKIALEKSTTICLDLAKNTLVLKGTPIKALKETLKDIKLTDIVIITPQSPSKRILEELSKSMATQGNCYLFLNVEEHALTNISKLKRWQFKNYIPNDRSNGLHGKAFYGEWAKNNVPGAILYLGSANFTQTAYTGSNIESGIIIKGYGEQYVKELRKVLSCLLGRYGSISKSQEAWATERFNGRWQLVKPLNDNSSSENNIFIDRDDFDLSQFIQGLKAKNHILFFPAKYGRKNITKAILKNGYVKRNWKSSSKRQFASVIWVPDLVMQITLKGSRSISIDIPIPPLEGLMSNAEDGNRLLGLLLSDKNGSNGQSQSKTGTGETFSIYSDSRVLFPWRVLIRKGYGKILLNPKKNRKEIVQTIESINSMLQEKDDDEIKKRKLQVIKFCLESLLNK